MEILGQDSKRFFEKGITLIEGLISTVIVGIGLVGLGSERLFGVGGISGRSELKRARYLGVQIRTNLRNSQKICQLKVTAGSICVEKRSAHPVLCL